MKIKITVSSLAYDTSYGGEQIVEAELGEIRLDDIFRLPFFRIIIDEVIDDAVCFRLMEGGIAHYFVLDKKDRVANFSRETSIGEDNFVFEYID
jgi:hypothetical protein